MALLNPKFSEPGASSGLAANWTLSASTSAESIAGFGAAPEEGWEDFERWCDFVADFNAVPQVRAFFVNATLGYESFNRGWSNDLFLTEFGQAQLGAAKLSDSGEEGFEHNWSNAPFFLDWTTVTAATAVFDGEPFEDFEEQWRNNQLYAIDWTLVTSAAASFDGGTNSREGFEGAWSLATSQ